MTAENVSEQLVQSFLMGSKQSQSGQRRLELLNKVASLGSLSAAAKACGMSYKGAWQAIDAMNQLSETPLVNTQKGGAGGGGMTLTSSGQSLVTAYQLFNERMQQWMRQLETLSPDMLSQLDLMRKISMKTSARNLFYGSITKVEKGGVNCDITLAIGGGHEMVAQITLGSFERLGLAVGSDAYALIKASWVVLADATEGALKTSARNQLCGSVLEVASDEVNSDVSIQLDGGLMVSAVVTNQSVKNLGLAVGNPCCALVKASHVLLAVAD